MSQMHLTAVLCFSFQAQSDSFWQRVLVPEKKRLSVKIQLLNIFKGYHIVAYLGPTAVGYGK